MEFLKKLTKAKNKQAIRLLQTATDDEYKSVLEVLSRADKVLNPKEIKNSGAASLLKKLKKRLTRKQFIALFRKFSKQFAVILGCILCRILEQNIAEVYNGELC